MKLFFGLHVDPVQFNGSREGQEIEKNSYIFDRVQPSFTGPLNKGKSSEFARTRVYHAKNPCPYETDSTAYDYIKAC